MQLYVSRNGQQAGPYSVEQVQSELASGSLQPGDLAWYEGAPGWLPLFSVPGLNAPAPYPVTPPYFSNAPQTSGLAVASMVLGLLGLMCVGLTALPAVICGHLSLSQIKRSAGRVGGQGMAITGLVTGYLMLLAFGALILALIAGLALPVFNHANVKNKSTRTLAQGKQIGLACKLYATDHDGDFPKTLDELVPTYLSDEKLFVCPLDSTDSAMGYEYFGGNENDGPRKMLLRSKAATADGKRVVIYSDDSAELVAK